MTFGTPLFSHALHKFSPHERLSWHWRIHHALYDRWSTALILEAVKSSYVNGVLQAAPLFSSFAHAAVQQEWSNNSADFWRSELASFTAAPYPKLPHGKRTSRATRTIEFTTPILKRDELETTQATSIQLALALSIAKMQGGSNVGFGMTLHGRSLSGCSEADRVVGPTIATVPVHIRIDLRMTIHSLLDQMQKYSALVQGHEHYGLHKLKLLGPGPALAAAFNTLLVIQPELGLDSKDLADKIIETTPVSSGDYLDCPLAFECFPYADGVTTRLSYDPEVVPHWNAQTIAGLFSLFLGKIETQMLPTTAVCNLDPLDDFAKDKVLEMSLGTVTEYRKYLHNRIFEKATAWREQTALEAWDASYTYAELCRLAHILGRGLQKRLGPSSSKIIPVCYPKSASAVLAMLAVLSAGHAFLMIELSLPIERINYMANTAEAVICICLSETRHVFQHLNLPRITLEDVMASAEKNSQEPELLCSPESPAYCIFTSG
jgi:hypothetical protein